MWRPRVMSRTKAKLQIKSNQIARYKFVFMNTNKFGGFWNLLLYQKCCTSRRTFRWSRSFWDTCCRERSKTARSCKNLSDASSRNGAPSSRSNRSECRPHSRTSDSSRPPPGCCTALPIQYSPNTPLWRCCHGNKKKLNKEIFFI